MAVSNAQYNKRDQKMRLLLGEKRELHFGWFSVERESTHYTGNGTTPYQSMTNFFEFESNFTHSDG